MRYPYGNGSKKIKSYSLDGSINGFQSHTHRIEKDSVFIVVLRNVKESVYEKQIVIKWATSMVPHILGVLYGEEYDLQKKSAAFEVFKTLLNSGKVEAENLMADINNNKTDKYYIKKREFEFFNQLLRDRGMKNQAAEYEKIHKKPRKKLTSQAIIQVYRFTIGKYFYFSVFGIQLI